MKAGTESKTKLYVAIGLSLVAVLTVGWSLLPGGTPTPTTSAPVVAPATKVKDEPKGESLDPRLHLDLLANSEDVTYEGKGTNIFREGAEAVNIPTAKVSPLLRQQQQAAAARQNVYTPPPPPPINLKYFGISNAKGEKPKAFLSQGDDVWIAREGDVVNRQYKIVRISPNGVEVEDLLNNNRQNIPLTQG